jgi:2-methylcitrate dehydratase PrpD
VPGKEFLLALAAGVELHARFGLACFNCLATGWHPTTLFGSLAASLAAGRLLKLDPERLRSALGIAFHQASGSVQSAYDGVIAKRLGPGFAARDAVLSAFLAADGIGGTHNALEGKAGFLSLYARGEVTRELLTEGLGTRWRIEEYSLKPYPGCRCNHAAIGLAVKLHEQGLPAGAVETVEIRMSETNWNLVGKPYDVSLNSVVHAQFNAAYSFARALADGKVGPRSYEPAALGEPAVASLAQRTRVSIGEDIDRKAMEPVFVSLKLKDGRTIALEGNTVKGSREEPMTDREILAKLRDCLEFGLDAPAQAAEQLAETVFVLEHEADAVRRLLDLFPARREGRS